MILAALGAYKLAEESLPSHYQHWRERMHRGGLLMANGAAVLLVGIFLTEHWLPLGPEKGLLRNLVFVAVLIGGLLAFFQVFQKYLYRPILWWCLNHKLLVSVPARLDPAARLRRVARPPIRAGTHSARVRRAVTLRDSRWPSFRRSSGSNTNSAGCAGSPGRRLHHQSLATQLKWTLATTWKGFGKEFMPPLDEGSYLYMPTTMPHASIGEAMDVLSLQDRRINSIPEVELAVGKIGRVRSPLDPAPISMIETVINYRSEYIVDKDGRRDRIPLRPGRSGLGAGREREPACRPTTVSRTTCRASSSGMKTAS